MRPVIFMEICSDDPSPILELVPVHQVISEVESSRYIPNFQDSQDFFFSHVGPLKPSKNPRCIVATFRSLQTVLHSFEFRRQHCLDRAPRICFWKIFSRQNPCGKLKKNSNCFQFIIYIQVENQNLIEVQLFMSIRHGM